MTKLQIHSELLNKYFYCFPESRLRFASASVYDNIQKNNLTLFFQKSFIVSSKQQLVSIPSNRKNIWKLINFFNLEKTNSTASLSQKRTSWGKALEFL